MIFVDTSVWIRTFRARSSPEAEHLMRLLDIDEVALPMIVRLEILSGMTERNRAAVRRSISALPTYRPERTTWDRAERWVDEAAAAGQRFGVADLLIAATTAESEGQLWSLDEDFERMAALGFVTLHVPREA